MGLGTRVRSWLRRLSSPPLVLAVGAETCRYALPGPDGEVVAEPSMLWRRRDTGKVILDERSIGVWAEGTLVCRNREAYECIRPFGGGSLADRYTVGCVLRYFGWRLSEHLGCRRPNRLVLTGRPDLIETLRPFIEDAARGAGFRRCALVAERECLAREAEPDPGAPSMLVDIGLLGTRVYGPATGQPEATVVESDAGGARMCAAIRHHAETACKLLIGPRQAGDILAKVADPGSWPCELKGRDVASDRPARRVLTAEEASDVLRSVLQAIVDVCRQAVDPFGVGSTDGLRVVLAGAAASTGGICDLLAEQLGARVELLPQPGAASVRGLARLLADGTAKSHLDRHPRRDAV